jgi:hypothetical protein
VQERESVSTWALLAALVLAALAACADKGPKNDAPKKGQFGAGVYVNKAWTFAREVTGHRIHVVEKKIECTKCHEMAEDKMGPVKPERCVSCHEKEGKIQHAHAQAEERFGAGAKAVCTACHAFTLEGTKHDEAMLKGEAPRIPLDAGPGKASFMVESYEPGDCKRCHGEKQGQLPAVEVHDTVPCLSCHTPHEAVLASAPCSSSGCHEAIKTTHASAGKTLEQTCSACHQHRHAPAKDALTTCVTCHQKQEPIVPASALFAGGHTDCIGCHKPHEFEQKAATPCRSCHERVAVIGAGRIGAHNACASCHTPHDVRTSAPAACANCHKNVHSDHPKQAGSCVGCHDPHPNQAVEGVGAKACSSCHSFAKSDHEAHKGTECTGCHKPHQFGLELTSVATCKGCHSERVHETASNKGHQECTKCHQGLPHHPEPMKADCASCHQREAKLANPNHQACTQCHEPHSGAQSAACGSCHRAEQQTAPKGHQACVSCHEPHAGLPAQKACADCHRDEKQSPHGQLGSGCQTCHRPHGPKGVASVPACSTCHQLAKLPGLHQEAKHQPCGRCHSGHEDPSAPKREICVGCHKDRTNHFPQSPRCASCHLFTAGP